MYIYPQWTFKKNFAVDLFTGHITKTSDGENWDARAYITDAFDFNGGVTELIGAGIRVFHNTNEGEVTNYAFGLSGEDYPNNIFLPEQLDFAFHFHDDGMDILHEGTVVFHQAEALNTSYFMEIESDQTFKAFYEDEDRNPVLIFDCPSLVDFDKFHAILLASKAEYTDLKIQVDFDGIKSKKIMDVQYSEDETTFTSVYNNLYDIPISASIIRVLTDSTIREKSLNKDSVKIYRYLPASEDIDNDKVQIEYTVPYEWGSNNYFDIYVNEFKAGYVYQFIFGTNEFRLVSDTHWQHIIDNLETPYYTNMDDTAFVEMLYNVLLERPSDSNGMIYWTGLLAIPATYTREQVVMGFVNGVEYQSKTAPLSPPESEIPFELSTVVFKTDGEIPSVDEIQLNQFFNDIYFKARNLDALIDIDQIVHEVTDIFDYEYPVTEYDAENNTYFKVQDQEKIDAMLDNTDLIKKFENSKIIEQLFVSQYLPEYARYMTDLNDQSIILINAQEAENLKEILFKNITLMNYFKGNKTQMQFLISIFSSSIGYYYVSVDPDPYNNFIYRVSTTLPEKYWIDDIKDITHPLGWNDFYVYVPKDALNWHQMKILDAEEFEEFWEMHSQLAPISYIDVADYLDEYGNTFRYGTYTGNAMLSDLTSPKEFPFKETSYSAKVEYHNTSQATATEGLFYDLRTEYRNVSVDVAVPESQIITGDKPLFKILQTENLWEIEFLRSGIAAVYKWRIYKGASLFGTIETHSPRLKFLTNPNDVFNIVLDLNFQDMSMPIFNYKLDNRHIKLTRELPNGDLTNFLDKSVDDEYNSNNAMLLGDSGSEKEYTFNESNYDAELDFARISSIISNINITNVGNKYEVFYNDVAGTENLISGLFNEFHFIIRDGGSILFEVDSTVPKITMNSTGVNLEVILKRDDVSYIGPNITI